MDILTQQSANLLHLMPEKQKADVSKQVRSPMPGLVKSVSCSVGDLVSEGQELCVIGKKTHINSVYHVIFVFLFYYRGYENAKFYDFCNHWTNKSSKY